MGQQDIMNFVVEDQLKTDLPVLNIGDTLDVHVRIIEGVKERIQVYQGVYIARRGSGVNESITVRRIVANQGVERIFPLHSPRIAKIEIVRRADARRSKLYFLRDRVGKSRRLRDQRRDIDRLAKDEKAQADRTAAAAAKAKEFAAASEAESGE